MRRTSLACALALLALALPAAAQAGLSGAPETVADGLSIPWEVVLMPDGRTLVTERPGRVREVGVDGSLRTVYEDETAEKFLGLALHPDYATNRLVYLYVSYGVDANPNANRVIRLRDDGTNLVEPQTIFQGGIKSDGNHDGGRIAFGPDGKLYVTTGDVHDPSLPQSLDSLNGKILRLNDDGSAPADNPFNSAEETGVRRFIWSYGHRHPQGIGWDAQGRMWETEHGPSGEGYSGRVGGRGGHDEINRIDAGANYGWPVIIGDETEPGMRTPVVHSGSERPAWAPGGLAFGTDGRLYAPLLAGRRLLELGVSCDSVTDRREHFGGDAGPGRLRAATAGRGYLWLTTSNGGSDELLRVPFDGAPPPPAPACEPPAEEPAATDPSPGSSPEPAPTSDPSPEPRKSDRARVNPLRLMLVNGAGRLRDLGLAGLRRRGRLVLKSRGMRRGRMLVRLEQRRPGRRTRILGRARYTVRDGDPVRLALRLTDHGRRALRRPKTARLTLRATLRSPGKRLLRRSIQLRLRRR